MSNGGRGSSLRRIPLPAWISGALDSVDASDDPFSAFGDPRSVALTSEAYLLAGLKVAHSLAVQLCQAEDSEGHFRAICNGGGNRPPGHDFLPVPATNWADSVSVHLSSGNRACGDIGDGTKLQYFCIQDESASELSYLSVNKAELLPTLNFDHSSNIQSNEMMRIHSLGLVLYQIFSGGDTPAEASRKSNGCQESLEELEPLPLATPPPQNNDAIDLANALKLSEEIDASTYEQLTPNIVSKKRMTSVGSTTGNPSLSIESLKTKGLPMPLCDLVANMLDSGNGDLSGIEAYRQLSDVASDLQMMIDRPHKFLHGIDLEQLSMSGFQLNETIFGREDELSTLQVAYLRSVSGVSEMTIISGPSGTGKSVLAHRLGNFVNSRGDIFIEGKFDQLVQTRPFSAVASALNEYCNVLVKEGDRCVHNLAYELKLALGKEVCHLVKLIPNLSLILGREAGEFVQDQDLAYAQNRALHLMCQLVEVLSNASKKNCCLLLDDCQWADFSSIEFLKHLLLISGSTKKRENNIHFVGCCREMSDDHPFCNLLSRARSFGSQVTTVKLKCMDETTMNNMMSDLLCLSPRLTRKLSHIIMHKTKGNPLFFSQLMISLGKDNLLRLSLSRRRWVWDEEKIQSRKISDDVASFLASAIERLPLDVKSSLCVMSCFGNKTDFDILMTLERNLGLALVGPLELAATEGLLDKVDNSFIFSHDRFQEAAYSIMRPEERPLFHLKYGLALLSADINDLKDDVLFAAVGQINNGGPAAVEDAQQAVLISNLNLLAGNKAIAMSDFSLAHKFFDHGISFLRRKHWKEHYNLSYQLFNAAAESAFAIGDLVSVRLLSEQVLKFAKTFEEKLNVLYMTVSALSSASQLTQCVEKSLSILSQLGEEMPLQVSETDVKCHLNQTKKMLAKISDEQLLGLNNMTDRSKVFAMKFYRRLELVLQQERPALQPIVTLKIVNLTLTHGLSPVSPIGFTYFGVLLARLGDIREGYKYTKIARRLLDKIGSKEGVSEVIALGTQVASFVEPLQAAIEYHREGFALGMETGDTYNALFNILFCSVNSHWAGKKLQLVKDEIDDAVDSMVRHNCMVWVLNTRPAQRSTSILIAGFEGNTKIPSVVDGEASLSRKNSHAKMTDQFQRVYIYFMFREFDQMKAAAEQYFMYDMKSWSLLFAHAVQSFYCGLASFWMYRILKNPSWAERGHASKLEMKQWAQSCQWNFQGKLLLLEAEEFLAYNDFKNARVAYENAITASNAHRFINDEALSCELAGYFHLQMNEQDLAVNRFIQAHEKYAEWGAIAKADALFKFVQQSLGPTSVNLAPSTELGAPPSTNLRSSGTRKRQSDTY